MSSPAACKELRQELLACIQRSNCIIKTDRSVQECYVDHYDDLPVICKSIDTAFQKCKRSLVDKRTRFRGMNATPTAPSTDDS